MDATISGTHYVSAQGRMETLRLETNQSSALPLMEVIDVETDQPLAPPKPNQPYRGGRFGPRGQLFTVVTSVIAVGCWAVLRYGTTLLNTTSNGGLTSSPTWMPTDIPSTKPTFTPTGPSAAPTPMPSSPSTGMSTTLPSSKLTSTPAGPSLAPISKLSSIPTRLATSATITNFLLLDVTQLNDFSSANFWNITKVSHGKNVSLHKTTDDPATKSGSVLQVNYPAGSYKPSAAIVGGIGVYASPAAIFPARSVQLSYEVFFPANFDPIKGGKLPGLYIGPPGAAGGNHLNNEASCRIMWRKNNLVGGFMAEAYVYINKTQDPSYYLIPGLKLDPVDGDSVWRGLVNFKKGSWNKIDMILTANTMTAGLANADGFLNLTINSVSQTFDKFIYTTTASAINGITFTTFFGGSDATWATLVATSTFFKNVQVQKLS